MAHVAIDPHAAASAGARSAIRRRLGSVIGAVALVAILAACMSADESAALTALNADRGANGQAALVVNDEAQTKAQTWSRHLAENSGGACNSSTLHHSDLRDGAPAGWHRLAENVACRTVTGSVADAVAPLQAQLMASPGHRANILDSRFTHVGIGIAAQSIGTDRWVVFETQYFVQL